MGLDPWNQVDYLGELSPYSLMLMVDKNGRCIRLTRRTKELGIELALQMTDSNSSQKGDQYSFFIITSFEWRIPGPIEHSLKWTKEERELGTTRWQKVEWLEREDPLTKEIWMPMLPNWLNAVKMVKEKADSAWREGEVHVKVLEAEARKDMK